MKIGILLAPDAANGRYRALGPANALSRRGHEVVGVWMNPDGSYDHSAFLGCDVVHIYRHAEPTVLKGADDLRQRGIAVTWDNDDDIRLLPAGSPQSGKITRLVAEKDFAAQTKMLRRADVVTTTSRRLAETYRELTGAEVIEIENYLDTSQFPRGSGGHDGLVVGWVAGVEHHADEKGLGISGVLRRALEQRSDLRVVSIGVRLDLPEDRYTHHALLPFEELAGQMSGFDIGIAPLADIPMSYARSNIKVKEYAAAGTPWLASARGPYEGLGEGQGGRLVRDDAWADAILDLAGSRWKRRKLARRAAAWAKTQTIDRHADRWLAAFERAVEAAARRSAATRSARAGS